MIKPHVCNQFNFLAMFYIVIDLQREDEMEALPGKKGRRNQVLSSTRLSHGWRVTAFLKMARGGSAPGPNGVSYKVYKVCDQVRHYSGRCYGWQGGVRYFPRSGRRLMGSAYTSRRDPSCWVSSVPLHCETSMRRSYLGCYPRDWLTSWLQRAVDTSTQKAGVPGINKEKRSSWEGQALASAICPSSKDDVAYGHPWSGYHPRGSDGMKNQWHAQAVVWSSSDSNNSSTPWPFDRTPVTHDITHRGVQVHQEQVKPNVTWLNRPRDQ